MENPHELQGVLVPLVTPFRPDGAVDYHALGGLIDLLIEKGVHGFLANAATGEFFHLDEEERRTVAEFVVTYVAGRSPVIIGAGETSTREAVRWARHAEKVGADGILLMPPYYVPLPKPDVMAHVVTVADAVSIPTMYYSNPGASQVMLNVAEICELVRSANVPWLKLSTADISQVPLILNEVGDKVRVFEGWDPLAFQSMCSGAAGWIAGPANAVPEPLLELWRLVREEQDLARASELNGRLASLLALLAMPGMFTPGIKCLLAKRGLEVGGVRAPYRDLLPEAARQLDAVYDALGLASF